MNSLPLYSTPQCELAEFLIRLRGLGRKSVRRILPHFSSLQSLLESSDSKLQQAIQSLSPKAQYTLIQTLKDPPDLPRERPTYFSYLSSIYPQEFEQLFDAPAGLYYRGDLEILSSEGPRIGIVGTRHASNYALKICEKIIQSLQTLNPVIVSGLALGIDGRAHQEALDCKLKTIAILGSHIDVIYPPTHRSLHQCISREGLLLSESPPGAELGPWSFPERNRLIAALSDILIVVEAPEKSGALVTAKFALELGRDIYVVPGSIDSPRNKGGHRLIQDGAQLLADPGEIFELLKPRILNSSASPAPRAKESIDLSKFSSEEQKILKILAQGPEHIDKIAELSQLASPQVMGISMELSLRGQVSELPGKVFESRI